MSLEPGQKLGPYELLAPLGAGGMGQVFRARDTRLGRDVALKLLPTATADDPDRIRRFEQEARAASSIEHPAVLTIHDVGVDRGVRYLVTELLEGETLRRRLERGSIPPAELISIARQLADGLAAAHARGVVHRDLKPENLFLTQDGRLKILDFGIARLLPLTPAPVDGTVSDAGTSPGTILGTAGYMSPEQVRGLPTDARTDLFSFGAILFELATGRRAFPGDTAIDRALSIIREDPPPVGRSDLPPLIDELVRRCTAKAADARTQSAREIAQRLDDAPSERPLARSDAAATSGANLALARPARPRWSRVTWVALWVGSVAAAALGGARLVGSPPPARVAHFQRITYRPGTVGDARFAPDGKNVIFTAFSGRKIPRTYITMPGLPEARPLTEEGTFLHSVSPQGELMVGLVNPKASGKTSVLARVPMGGGAPRRIRENAGEADWAPNGSDIAIITGEDASSATLEYPLGNRIYSAEGSLSSPRVSPDGALVAFADHPHGHDDMGYIAVAGRDGTSRRLTPRFGSVSGLAWMPSGREIIFTAAKTGLGRAVYFVDLDGHLREGPNAPVDLQVTDVAPDGTVLLKREIMRIEVLGKAADADQEIDLCWFDWGVAEGVTDDGKSYVFVEGGAAGGARYITYFRGLDGSPPVRLGDGSAMAMSGSGALVALVPDNDRTRLSLVPTQLGVARPLDPGPIRTYEMAAFLPDEKHILIGGRDATGVVRLYVQPLDPPGPPVLSRVEAPIAATTMLETSPDGREVLLIEKGGRSRRYLLATGEERPLLGLRPRDMVQRWTSHGTLLAITATSACAPCDEAGDMARLSERLGQLALRSTFEHLDDLHALEALGSTSAARHRVRPAPACACAGEGTGFDLALVEVDLATGERTELRRMLSGASPSGGYQHDTVHGIASMQFSRDGRAYVYGFNQISSDLFLMRL